MDHGGIKMERLPNIHPGEILLEEFLKAFKISAYKLAKDTAIPQTRISQIIKGNRRITADTALRFASYFGTSAKFWLGLQNDYDIEEERILKKEVLNNIKNKAPNHCA
ncbi:HigA family addiction module antitoxin [Geofilum rubicundum]|uniref:HigA protein n=1 Tax=Geofilum rubicundum JCM 15548 TaxID=1236989 RepID=A0A0E9M2E5_9BACT|nr:HigA family addiction module antitoxin [Geofilum rubicundum]GAO31689.1 HigA protein [Geofilum rubicundum JCM 15548]